VFCPQCKDEFRPGFTRCARCNVDLVDQLSEKKSKPDEPQAAAPSVLRMGEYCGFLSLDDARHARGQLRELKIRTDILVREPPDSDWDRPVQEEFWLRVDMSRMREVAAILGGVPEVDEKDQGGFGCGDCGQNVSEEEASCPKCGARFDD
jgi:hypothetical protein